MASYRGTTDGIHSKNGFLCFIFSCEAKVLDDVCIGFVGVFVVCFEIMFDSTWS